MINKDHENHDPDMLHKNNNIIINIHHDDHAHDNHNDSDHDDDDNQNDDHDKN